MKKRNGNNDANSNSNDWLTHEQAQVFKIVMRKKSSTVRLFCYLFFFSVCNLAIAEILQVSTVAVYVLCQPAYAMQCDAMQQPYDTWVVKRVGNSQYFTRLARWDTCEWVSHLTQVTYIETVVVKLVVRSRATKF